MRVVVCEPNQPPQVRDISGDLESMQEIVGGCIEMVAFPPHTTTVIVCNDEGSLRDLLPNRLGVVGTFFIAKTAGPEFIGLTDVEAEIFVDYLTRIAPNGFQPEGGRPKMRAIDQLKQLLESQVEDLDNWPKVTPTIEPCTQTDGLNLILLDQQVGLAFSADGEKFLGVFNWKD